MARCKISGLSSGKSPSICLATPKCLVSPPSAFEQSVETANCVKGLTRDDETLRDDRIRLWEEFNRAWLVTLQRQFDMTQEVLQTNQPPREPQSIMSAQSLERLSADLVRLCDYIEKHGLVDYQLGVAEEDIMDCESSRKSFS